MSRAKRPNRQNALHILRLCCIRTDGRRCKETNKRRGLPIWCQKTHAPNIRHPVNHPPTPVQRTPRSLRSPASIHRIHSPPLPRRSPPDRRSVPAPDTPAFDPWRPSDHVRVNPVIAQRPLVIGVGDAVAVPVHVHRARQHLVQTHARQRGCGEGRRGCYGGCWSHARRGGRREGCGGCHCDCG